MAAGSAKPMVPRPPLVMWLLALVNLKKRAPPFLVPPLVVNGPRSGARRCLYGLHHLYGTVLAPRRLLAAPLRLLALGQFLAPLFASFATIRGVIQVSQDRTHRRLRVRGYPHGRLYDLAEL